MIAFSGWGVATAVILYHFYSVSNMDREILYRGINFQKEWVYGDLFHSYANDDIAIAYYREGCKTPTFDAIFPESFGQYTGLTDKMGLKYLREI